MDAGADASLWRSNGLLVEIDIIAVVRALNAVEDPSCATHN
jgi:hypothetical protein